jgi:hypothetical protein
MQLILQMLQSLKHERAESRIADKAERDKQFEQKQQKLEEMRIADKAERDR